MPYYLVCATIKTYSKGGFRETQQAKTIRFYISRVYYYCCRSYYFSCRHFVASLNTSFFLSNISRYAWYSDFMDSSYSRTPKIIGGLAVAIVIGVGSFLAVSGVTATTSSTATITTTATSQTTSSAAPVVATTADTTTMTTSLTSLVYKDGTYNATATYRVPGGQNSLTATLTIVSDKITVVKTTNSYDDRESQRYVDSFNSGISSAVVGSSLSDAYVGRVGGATLTTGAFDDVLRTIMNDAKA
jgi:hypothetical protein